MGVPVLCSDIPVMRQHLKERSARILWFDPESPESIASAMDELAENYQSYKASAVKGMNDPRPSWDDIADQYVQVFKKAILKASIGK